MKYATLGLLLAIAIGSTALLSGCNTMAGAGKDIQDAGQGIHNSAERHNPDNDK